MSHFVARLAVRAVRLTAPAVDAAPPLEVVDEEVVVLAPAGARRPEDPQRDGPTSHDRAETATGAPPAALAITPDALPSPPADPDRVPRRPEGQPAAAPSVAPAVAAEVADALAGRVPVLAGRSASARPVVAAATTSPATDDRPVVAATPAPSAQVWLAPTAPRSMDGRTADGAEPEPVVRVHIGRLDVRNAPAASSTERTEARPDRAPELSLTAYLRGERQPS